MDQVVKPDAPFGIDRAGAGWRRLDGPSLASSDACRMALAVYERAYRMCREMEPDVGFAERFTAGRRSLDARRRAHAWTLSVERMAAVEALLDQITQASADQAGDWMDRFPRVFMGILERRTSQGTLPDVPGRRFNERAPTPQPTARIPMRVVLD